MLNMLRRWIAKRERRRFVRRMLSRGYIGGKHTWTGAVDADWWNAGNWDTGEVPGKGSDILIPDGSQIDAAYAGAFGTVTLAAGRQTKIGTLECSLNSTIYIEGITPSVTAAVCHSPRGVAPNDPTR